MTSYSEDWSAEGILAIFFLVFIGATAVAWLANGCQPLWPEGNLAEGIVLGGLLLVFGLLVAIGLSEIINYVKKRS